MCLFRLSHATQLTPTYRNGRYKDMHVSIKENAGSPLLSRDGLVGVVCKYQIRLTTFLWTLTTFSLPSALLKADPTDPRFSILLAPDHGRVPRTYFQVAGADPMRDEAIIYEKILKEAGTETKLEL